MKTKIEVPNKEDVEFYKEFSQKPYQLGFRSMQGEMDQIRCLFTNCKTT